MANAVHVSLNVSNLDRSAEFYRRFFGEPTKRKADYVKFVGAQPEIHLALQPGRSQAGAGGALSHLGIRVDTSDAVRAWKRTLLARGLPAEEEKRESCCYALQDKFWVSDPDGNRWEVYNVIEDVEADAACEPRACCAR